MVAQQRLAAAREAAGSLAAGRAAELRRVGAFLLGFGIVMPVLHGGLGAALRGMLAASAGGIAAPACVRLGLPLCATFAQWRHGG